MYFVVRVVFVVIFVICETADIHARVGLCPRTPAEWPTGEIRPSPQLFNFGLTHQVAAHKAEFFRMRRALTMTSSLVTLLLMLSGFVIHPGPAVQMGLFNARSVVNRGPLIQDLITSHHLDTLAVCETWIVDDDPDAITLDVVPPGYAVAHLPRPSATTRTRGGGLCFIHRDSIIIKSHPLQGSSVYSSFECQLATLRAGKTDDVTIAVIYRPPSMSLDSIESFLDDLSDLLVKLGDVIEADRLVLCGDFNCLGSNSTSIRTDLSSLLDAHGLQQFVTTATRRTLNVENLLDLVIGGAASTRIRQVGARSSHGVSDHDLVTWSLVTYERPPRHVHTYRFRNLKAIDLEQFKCDIYRSDLFSAPASTAEEFADQLDETVTSILDVHCPLQSKRCISSSRRDSRWLSQEAVIAKRDRRRLERKWRSSRDEVDFVAYRRMCRAANTAIIKSRHDYYSKRIGAAGSDPRKRWSVIREVCIRLSDMRAIQMLPANLYVTVSSTSSTTKSGRSNR